MEILSILVGVGILQFLASRWIEARLKASIEHEYREQLAALEHDFSLKLEEFKFEFRKREQAAKVAHLLAIGLDKTTTPQAFNEAAWELSLWLPAEIVRHLTGCLCGAEGAPHPKEILIQIRKLLQGPDDTLLAEQIVHRGA